MMGIARFLLARIIGRGLKTSGVTPSIESIGQRGLDKLAPASALVMRPPHPSRDTYDNAAACGAEPRSQSTGCCPQDLKQSLDVRQGVVKMGSNPDRVSPEANVDLC